jgi:hypothetical protein
VSVGSPPASSQHYYDFSRLPDGMGPVIDIVGVSTTSTVTVVVNFAAGGVDMGGVYVGRCVFCPWLGARAV